MRKEFPFGDLVYVPEINFSCTQCGRCCHDHSLPLTLDEAIAWAENEGRVAIFCEAIAWCNEPRPDDLRAIHRKKRSFKVSSGSTQGRVIAILVGVISGACKNLGEDMRCKIYDQRPLVCRIYPAEISPFIQLNKAAKACPPESWEAGGVLVSDNKAVDPLLREMIELSRQTDREDALRKGMLCSLLDIKVSAICDEGFAIYEPRADVLLTALKAVREIPADTLSDQSEWRMYSPLAATRELLQSQGLATLSEVTAAEGFSFVGVK